MMYRVIVDDGRYATEATMNQNQLLNFLVAHLDSSPHFKLVQDTLDRLGKGLATTFNSHNIGCYLYLVKVIPQA